MLSLSLRPLSSLLLPLVAAAASRLSAAAPPHRLALMALSSSWDGSNVHEDHVEFLRQTRRLPSEDFVRVHLAPEKEISPAPEEGE